MGRKVKDARFDSRQTRGELAASREPYWRLIHQGLHLGYRKGPLGGVWIVRVRAGVGYRTDRLGKADDMQDSNGETILSFKEAQIAALKYMDPEFKAKNTTVGEAAEYYMRWFEQHRKTAKNTQTYLNAHILPTFGKRLVADLKSREIKAWHEKLAATPTRKRTALGKSQAFSGAADTMEAKRARKASANRMLTILKALLNKAYEDELVSDDSAWKRVRPFPNTDEPVIRFLREDECERMIGECALDFRPMVKAALFTGARYSELAELKVEDVSLDPGRIFIRPGKSGKGRHVPLSPKGLKFFETMVTAGERGKNVFVRADGSAWGRDYQHRPMKAACERARIIPSIGFHDLRHTYASLLAQAGVDLLTISKLLGHADTRITSRHYAHLSDKTLANAVETHLPDFGH